MSFGDRAFFVTSEGMVFVAEMVETSTADSCVQERVEVMETMIRPHCGTMTPPIVTLEPRAREVERESLCLSERDLRNRMDLEEEALHAGGALKKKKPKDGDAAGTLPVEVDATECRFGSWRSAVICSSTYGHHAEGQRDNDRTLHELIEITDAFFYGAMVDQLNFAAILSFDVLARQGASNQ